MVNGSRGMSLIICVAHSGQKLSAEPTKVSNLDALRAWVQHAAGIPVNKQVFLTNKGKSVRPQALLTEVGVIDVYVYLHIYVSRLARG